MGKISRKQLPINIKVTRNRTIGPRRNNRRIYFNLARPTLNRIRQGKTRKKKAGGSKSALFRYDKSNR